MTSSSRETVIRWTEDLQIRPTTDQEYSRRVAAFPGPLGSPWGGQEAHWSLRSGRGAARPSDHAPTSGNLQRLLLYLEKRFQTPLSALRCGVGRPGAAEGLPPSPAPATPQPLLPAGSATATRVPAGAAPLGRQLCPEGPAGLAAATRQERPVPSALPSGLTLTASVSGHPSPSACQAHRVPGACPWGGQESLGGGSLASSRWGARALQTLRTLLGTDWRGRRSSVSGQGRSRDNSELVQRAKAGGGCPGGSQSCHVWGHFPGAAGFLPLGWPSPGGFSR